MNILAFESSCDETAAAVVRDGRTVLSDAILSQADMHALYGGVVPEIASRKHVQAIAALTDKALSDAGLAKKDIDAVAVTYAPGLIGAVLVLLTVAVMLNLKRSKYGRAIMAIRDNRIAAESVGLNVTWYKLAVFVIAAFFAGCAGVLYGHSLANIKAAAFDYNMSIEILVIVVLGGMGSVPGSVISAIVLTVLPEALREVADYRMLVYAIVLILVMQATNNPTMKRFFASAKEKLTPGRKERAAL